MRLRLFNRIIDLNAPGTGGMEFHGPVDGYGNLDIVCSPAKTQATIKFNGALPLIESFNCDLTATVSAGGDLLTIMSVMPNTRWALRIDKLPLLPNGPAINATGSKPDTLAAGAGYEKYGFV